jgi:hypothetical protein
MSFACMARLACSHLLSATGRNVPLRNVKCEMAYASPCTYARSKPCSSVISSSPVARWSKEHVWTGGGAAAGGVLNTCCLHVSTCQPFGQVTSRWKHTSHEEFTLFVQFIQFLPLALKPRHIFERPVRMQTSSHQFSRL